MRQRISVMGVVLLASLPAWGHDPAEEMAEAAGRFLKTLDEKQLPVVKQSFEGEDRKTWHFVPDRNIPGGKRKGLPIKEMTQQQRLLAHGLLSTALSHSGYRTAVTIMALESILHELEGKNPIRDPEIYYLSVYGEPSTTKTWGWRWEGHHLSLNMTLVDGKKIAVTPSFFGSNPAEVPSGPLQGMKVLGDLEDQGRALARSLSDEQKKKAILDSPTPKDVITTNDRVVNKGVFFPPVGLPFEELTADQQKQLLTLVNAYAGRYRDPIIAQINARTPITDGKGMVFAWIGSIEPKQGHYYRIQTPTFLIEYDNTQNNANHVHAVWRQFDGDFGADLLREHYDKHHQK